jgi:hypothetical protein
MQRFDTPFFWNSGRKPFRTNWRGWRGRPWAIFGRFFIQAEATGLTKPQVAALFEGLAGLIKKNLAEQGPGVYDPPKSPPRQKAPALLPGLG